MISSGMNLVMTVIGFAVSIMFIVFVCTRLICARIHLNSSRRSFPIASRSDLSLLERGLHGVEPVVVANFPMKKFSDEYFAAAEDTQQFNVVNLVGKKESSSFRYSIADPRCAVCLAEYHGEDTLRILPYCGHSFHATCIDIWLHQHSTCPVCRVSLRELPERKRLMQPIFSSAIRSHYGTESFDTHSYNYLSGHGFSSRTVVNRGMDSVPEDHCASDDDITDSGGNISPTTEGNQTTKDLGNKHVESPSNP
ncbi:hypothetical protein WN944_018721 [Citrus x changshan-huyou]|uniref:RING-type domain-containing protein n=2 Tax=Citrus TaxID=2706 RepID=A0ACB8L6J3_CITSI|nr:RING-type domain-containing protein [Citrus sinensis]